MFLFRVCLLTDVSWLLHFMILVIFLFGIRKLTCICLICLLPENILWMFSNSEEAESYHSWSGNGRWMVFSSRRIDGLYTRLFIGYVDSEGVGHKPFLLPQKDPLTYYDALMFSYNIPELMRSAVTVDACRLAGCLRSGKKQI